MRKILFFLLLILCTSLTSDPPQRFFYSIEEESDEYYDWVESVNYELIEGVFKSPEEKRYYIGPEAFDSAHKYDFSKLKNLESLNILLGWMPDAPDSEKTAYQQKVKAELTKISCLSKCPKLKRVIFTVCNRIYLTEAQCKPKIREREFGKRYTERTVRMNLHAAWNSFGNPVQEKLPGIKLYAIEDEW